MTDEFTLRQALADGERAKALLTDEVLVAAFDRLQKAYFDAWRLSEPTDAATRERLHIAFDVLEKVKGNLQSVVANGAIAKVDLKAAGLI